MVFFFFRLEAIAYRPAQTSKIPDPGSRERLQLEHDEAGPHILVRMKIPYEMGFFRIGYGF